MHTNIQNLGEQEHFPLAGKRNNEELFNITLKVFTFNFHNHEKFSTTTPGISVNNKNIYLAIAFLH